MRVKVAEKYFSAKTERLHAVNTVSQKNAPTFASCIFDKHGLILIILDKQHQNTFGNDMRIQLSLSLYFYLTYLLLNSCDENDAKYNVLFGITVRGSEKSRLCRVVL